MRIVVLLWGAGLAVWLLPGAAWAATFQDCRDCPTMVGIPAGHFIMGSPTSEPGRHQSEAPHAVTIPHPFAIGVTDVTVAQFAQFAAATHFTPAPGGCFGLSGLKWSRRPWRSWDDPGYAQTPNDPVVCLTWSETEAYLSWLSRKTGKAYRLPSSAEWEYAARAGSTTARPWGDGISRSDANYGNDQGAPWAEGDDHWDYTSPVGSFPPNRFGLYDMLGNVWEWMSDCIDAPIAGPPNSGDVLEPGPCPQHLRRGGGWEDPPDRVSSTSTIYMPNNHRSADGGFRVARDLP